MKIHQNSSRVLGPEDARRFKKAARAYTKKVTRSPGAAQKALHKAGILTKSGKLTKNYR
jgi:hypothetical protein